MYATLEERKSLYDTRGRAFIKHGPYPFPCLLELICPTFSHLKSMFWLAKDGCVMHFLIFCLSGVKCVYTSGGEYLSLGVVWCQFSSIFIGGSSTDSNSSIDFESASTGSTNWPTFESTSQKGPGASSRRSPICHVGMRYGTKPWSIFIFHLIWLCQSESLWSCESSTENYSRNDEA